MTAERLSLARRAGFAVMVVLAFVGFMVILAIKRAPSIVQGYNRTTLFSPNGDGSHDTARFAFRPKQNDELSVTVVDENGVLVRRLANHRHVTKKTGIVMYWDGKDGSGHLMPDGAYHLRVEFIGQRRVVSLPGTVTIDTLPPRVRITRIDPAPGGGPPVVPGRAPATIHWSAKGGRAPDFIAYRTDGGRVREVARFGGSVKTHTATWNGRLDTGRAAPAGTYFIAAELPDRVGNIGTDPSRLPPRRRLYRVHRGVTVRYLAALPPLEPVSAGAVAAVHVDARGRRYTWVLRPAGGGRRVGAGAGGRPTLHVRVPPRRSGLYLLSIRADGHRTTVPIAAQAPRRHSAPLLVVLPSITWQGRNSSDDDGDGFPEVLDSSSAVRLDRPLARGLPDGFRGSEDPMLGFLRREHTQFDLTTDLALVRGVGPKLGGHRGVLIAGDARWLPDNITQGLRAYVARGGRVASLGVESMRRDVRVSGTRLVAPTPPAPTDALGSRIAPLEAGPQTLLPLTDRIGLLAGHAIAGVRDFEATTQSPGEAAPLATAGQSAARPVTIAYELGRGIVIRTGVRGFAGRIETDRAAAAIARRIVAILTRG
ncbi:MAG: hypothetical protein QOE08_2057 [Thermoleophilaceae bacterium]|jgi:hypothetical protein|nr:hypothetical protein [Thermoleophilaceae bacterium]